MADERRYADADGVLRVDDGGDVVAEHSQPPKMLISAASYAIISWYATYITKMPLPSLRLLRLTPPDIRQHYTPYGAHARLSPLRQSYYFFCYWLQSEYYYYADDACWSEYRHITMTLPPSVAAVSLHTRRFSFSATHWLLRRLSTLDDTRHFHIIAATIDGRHFLSPLIFAIPWYAILRLFTSFSRQALIIRSHFIRPVALASGDIATLSYWLPL